MCATYGREHNDSYSTKVIEAFNVSQLHTKGQNTKTSLRDGQGGDDQVTVVSKVETGLRGTLFWPTK